MKVTAEEFERQIRQFTEAYWRTSDIHLAIAESGMELPALKTPDAFAADLLERKDVKDLLALMGDGDEKGIDGMIARLGAARRMALKKGDYRAIKEIEGEIAKLRGYTTDAAPPPSAIPSLVELARGFAFLLAADKMLPVSSPLVIENAPQTE